MNDTNLYVKRQGATVDFIRASNLYTGNYYDGHVNDPIDGLQWTGSLETLIDCPEFNILQKIAPKIKFDYGEWSGFPNFQYVFVCCNSNNYNIYALTNNNTILQYVGRFTIQFDWSTNEVYGAHVYSDVEPNENYVPENTRLVETITCNDKVYTYYGHGSYFHEVWRNEQDGTFVGTDGYRNPYVGDSCYSPNGWFNITAVTYYDGITLPEWYTENDPNNPVV